MSGLYPTYKQGGPVTYEVSVSITGGQLVEFDGTTQKIKPAVVGSKAVLGVAMNNASPAGSGSPTDFGQYPSRVAVGAMPQIFKLKVSADVAAGALVAATANGGIGPAGSDTFDQVVGRCVDPAGITAGASGLIKLTI
jgi:hypothetical protein